MKIAFISCMIVMLLCACTGHSQQNGNELSNRRDSLSYALGVNLGRPFMKDSSFWKSEEDKALFLKGLDDMMDKYVNTDKKSGLSKSYAVGALRAIFMSDGISNNNTSVRDFVEGLNDAMAKNYSRMDTAQCRAFLDSFYKLPKEERNTNEERLKNASYAIGMMTVNLLNSKERLSGLMIEYDIPEEEQNVEEFIDGFVTAATASLLGESADPYILGKWTGRLMLMEQTKDNADNEELKHAITLNVQGLKDCINGKPLITEDKAAEMVAQANADGTDSN